MNDSQVAPARLEPGAGMRFRLPIYEGPLDLLLHLIKRAELDPHDVTASVITEHVRKICDGSRGQNVCRT